MTDILCRWLNEEVKLSITVDQLNFSREFATGFLIGEVLYKHGLQYDFEQFSQNKTADSKLNNFTRLEPTLKLLEVPYDTNVARDIMNQKHGVATRLMYQMFIALGRKTKLNLTGVAMETMRPRGPVKLEGIESGLYKERLKQLTPRQVDLNFETLIERFQAKQKEQEELAFKAKFEEEEMHRKYRQAMRQRELEKARQARQRQLEIANKIRDATVKIPKPPESKKSGRSRLELRKLREAEEARNQINTFEANLKTAVQGSTPSISEVVFPDRYGEDTMETFTKTQPLPALKSQTSDDYLKKIKTRLEEDTVARKEREKRRRRVLIQQMKAHEAQEEAHREEMLVNRLMRQSQQERRIAVQLMQVRHEKDVIRQNRIFRERQYAERRLKDFEDALNREAEMCRQARIEFAAQLKHDHEVHDAIAAEAAQNKYQKHYDACKEILLQVVDFSCKVGEYRELTEKKIPPKLLREWTSLFIAGAPLYPVKEEDEGEDSGYDEALEEEKQNLLNEGDFMEYKNLVGEWTPPEGAELPKKNPVLGHIIQRLFNIVNPPEPPPPPPEFPEFPIKACFLGKIFSGKSTVIQKLLSGHRLVRLCIDDLVEEAVEAHKQGEVIEEPDNEEAEDAEDSLQKRVSMSDQVNVLGEGGKPSIPNVDEGVPAAGQEGTAAAPEDVPAVTVSATDQTKEDAPKPEEAPKEVSAEETEKKDSSEAIEEVEKDAGSKKSIKDPESASKPKGPQPTGRAKLGGKAYQFLKKGKPIPDQLLVDIMVEAIRLVPDGTGWILDGFPGTINQAKLLEKSLTGYDATKEGKQQKEAKKPKKSRLVADPHPQVEPPAPKSGIDLVLLFDLPDETVLTRAEGRTYDPMSAEEYHQQLNPPPDGSYTGLGKQEKVAPVADPSNDKEQVQQRITGFVDAWPKLDKWYSKFGILSKVDVDKNLDEVFDDVSSLLVETVTRLHAPPEEKTTEEEPPPPVEEPAPEPPPPEEPPVPETPPESVSKTDSKSKGSKPGSPRSGKSGKKSGKKDRSPSPASSKKKDRSPSPSAKKKDRSPSPGKSKKGSTSPASSRKGSPTRRGKSPGRPGSKGSSKGSKRGKSPKGKPEPEPEPEEPQLPPEPEPGSEEWVYVDQELVKEMAMMLAKQWEGTENTYISTSKNTFHLVRDERELIYRYFYGTRKEFAAFLKRPDEKQEHVLLWQKYYNELATDMRSDEEVKAELHQTVDDLCDRLFEISDNRKEMAEQERQMIMTEGWLEDRLGLLTNHYISLMQVEVDRYQDTVRLLRDYYISMDPDKMPNEQISEYARLPLVELPLFQRPQSSSSKSVTSEGEVEVKPEAKSPASGKRDRESAKTPDPAATENPDEPKSRIPLVPRRPKSGEPGGRDKKDKKGAQKKDKSDDKSETPVPMADLEEKLVADAHAVALTIIDTLAQIDQAEQEAETQRQAELDKEKEKEMAKKSGKDKKDKKGRKSPKSPTKSAPPPETPPPPPLEDMTEEEKQKRLLKEKSRKEFLGAVTAEDHGLKSRLEIIKNHATVVLQELKGKAEETYKDMDEWLGTRFLQECDSIKNMSVRMRQAIEHEEMVQEELMLEDKEFVVDIDTKTFRTPTPPPPPSPVELALTEQFTVVQIYNIFKQFQKSAPSGVISVKGFTDMFQDLSALTHGMEMLPDSWTSASAHQFMDICQLLSPDSEYIDWKTFLVAACQPFPLPSNLDLLQTLENFTFADLSGTGVVDREQYQQVELWFTGLPDGSEYSNTYDRLGHMKELFFEIFADDEANHPVLDYINMLLYFSVHANPMDGFLRALSVVSNQVMPTSAMLPTNSLVSVDSDAHESGSLSDLAAIPEMNAMVSLDDLMRVFHHGESQLGDSHRFSVTSDPLDTYSRERLMGVFLELGVDELQPVPFYILYQHPILQDCMHMCQRYKMADLQGAFKSNSLDSFPE